MTEIKLYRRGSLAAGLNELRDRAHATARQHGWWEPVAVPGIDPEDGESLGHSVIVHRTFGDLMALVHSELSEALEDHRAGHAPDVMRWEAPGEGPGCLSTEPTRPYSKPVGIPSEMADVIIRVLDICGWYGIDIEQAVKIKMAYNDTRPYRHGEKAL